ncbi:MAG: type II toxin-antitoxin system RelE/ParE family toxin [Alphaproteobacteria bacterium]
MPQVRWSASARAGLLEISRYLADRNPYAGERIVARLLVRAVDLATNPSQGRPGRVAGTRELVVTGTPYLLVYRVTATYVEILRVLHGRRQWPPAGPSGEGP